MNIEKIATISAMIFSKLVFVCILLFYGLISLFYFLFKGFESAYISSLKYKNDPEFQKSLDNFASTVVDVGDTILDGLVFLLRKRNEHNATRSCYPVNNNRNSSYAPKEPKTPKLPPLGPTRRVNIDWDKVGKKK